MKRTIFYLGILGCLSGLIDASMGQEAANRKYTLAEKSIKDAKLNLPRQIATEDTELTRQVHDLYIDCLFDKLWEPALPGLPYRFFSITGAGDESYGKCQLVWDPMFVLNAWAPLDDHQETLSSKDQGLKLLGNRFFTFSTVVRVNQIEVSRDKNDGVDESGIHSAEAARTFRETIEKCWPGARISWAFSWLALKDQRPNYLEIKKLVVSYHEKFGDEITFLPGGFFANMYNSREQVNRDLHEGLQMVSEMVGGGYRPKSVIAGFLSAENQRFLAEEEGIHVCQGNIWSQYAVDNGDGEGSISYPYFPSSQHFCKPAQGKEDMIDCVNLDGWTVDFLMARYAAPRFINGIRCGSRQGVGPIETILRQGIELGTKEILATTSAHFDTGFKLNNFAWVTCIWELGLVGLEERDRKTRTGLDGLEIWLNEMRRRWPEAKCITHGEFGMLWREQFKNNDSINYRFMTRGSGVCGSEPELEIRWFMNKDFRLGLLRNWQENTPEKIIDFTRYDLPAKEPADPQPGESTRNWSLMNRLNQKGTRDQDKPVDFGQLSPVEQRMIKRGYPDFCTSALPAGKPLKVYILAGQSNMQGSAHLKTFKAIGDDPETSSLLNVILDKKGDPVACYNAWISYITQLEERDTVLTGKVGVGYGFDHERIGPEYAFSLWMDKAHDEPILIIKTAWGGKSLAVDFRPPSSGPYEPGPKEKAQGYAPSPEIVGHYYREMIRHVRETLKSAESIRKIVPGYDPAQGFELAGFVWFQGWNDMCNRYHIGQYTENMIHFISDVRKEFDRPTLPFIVGILGVYGTDPDSRKFDKTLPVSDFRKAQFAAVEQYDRKVAEPYRGNVKAVDSGPFYELALSDIYWKKRLTDEWKWRVKQGEMTRKEAGKERERYGFSKDGLTKEEQRIWDRCASNAEYHYLGSGKTFVRLGKAFAEAMLGMEKN